MSYHDQVGAAELKFCPGPMWLSITFEWRLTKNGKQENLHFFCILSRAKPRNTKNWKHIWINLIIYATVGHYLSTIYSSAQLVLPKNHSILET